MTKEEFKLKILEAFMEFNKDKDFDFLLVAVDRSQDEPKANTIIIGFGCGGCMASEIASNLEKFKHHTNEYQIN